MDATTRIFFFSIPGVDGVAWRFVALQDVTLMGRDPGQHRLFGRLPGADALEGTGGQAGIPEGPRYGDTITRQDL